VALNLKKEIARLESLTTPELRREFAELFGWESHSHNRRFLVRRIAWKLQEREYGGLSERARRRAEELAAETDLRVRPPNGDLAHAAPVSRTGATSAPINRHRDPRLPLPGTTITRRYKGRVLRVTVLERGFEFLGERHRSLTAVTRAATGSHWNGWLFFGLSTRKDRAK
jgi:hypothetical protein